MVIVPRYFKAASFSYFTVGIDLDKYTKGSFSMFLCLLILKETTSYIAKAS